MKITLKEIQKAHQLISSTLEPTPLVKNQWLSHLYGANIYLKLENMQPIGSFKIRGATNKIAQLSKLERARGVVAASAGNHAQGVAWASREFKTKATIIMPLNASITKIENTKALGAEVILHGQNIEESFVFASQLAKKRKSHLVHPFMDEKVIAGQASLGLEIMEQISHFDYIFGSIGGGGLVAGLGLALKLKNHPAKIIAAQASGARSMVESLNKKKLFQTHEAETFADGIRVKVAQPMMFDLLKQVVDEAHHCDDESIAFATLSLVEKARVIAEGAGALPLAALEKIYNKNPKKIRGKDIVLVICGGNIDVNLLGHIIDRGLLYSGRHLRVNLLVNDKPGTLNLITSLIANVGGNILQVIHDHDHPRSRINQTMIELTLETRGHLHNEEILKALQPHFSNLEVLRA